MSTTNPENSITPQQAPAKTPVMQAKKERCRFDMFCMLRNDVQMSFSTGAKEWCFRGDKWNQEPNKMLHYLLGIVKNHRTNYYLMELYDNTKPKECGERLILKILNNQVKVNRLNEYSELLKNYSLPEWLSYEVTN